MGFFTIHTQIKLKKTIVNVVVIIWFVGSLSSKTQVDLIHE